MGSPQDAIFQEDSGHHLWLEYDLLSGADTAAVRAALRGALDLLGDTAVEPDRRPRCVLAFGPVLWSRLATGRAPAGLHLFEGIDGPGGHHAPPTPHNIWIWLHGTHHDENVAAALGVHRALHRVARLAAEERGFRYRDSRDLTGFEDGTANPKGAERMAVALVPGSERGGGGSHVMAMRWVHDLVRWEQLTEGQQSKVIGRDKLSNEEFSGRARPKDAHIARVEIEVDGVEQAIYRRSVPFGGVREHGLYFVAFSKDASRFDGLLASMFGVTDGVPDKLLDYSHATSGAYYFAPCQQDLASALDEGR
jgi:putative iron-dependent peroxidase